MKNYIESRTQIACVRWFRLQYPEYANVLFAVPNGGARLKTEAKILKAEGATAGVSDLILLLPRHGFGSLCIEMKTEKGSQSISQRSWQKSTEKAGNKYVLCRNVTDFIREITSYLSNK